MIVKERMAAIKGTMPDPWDIRDAFLASAVYLGELGATNQTYEHEWCAALSYFSGNCSLRNQARYEFYGDSVMAIAARYEREIKTLQGNWQLQRTGRRGRRLEFSQCQASVVGCDDF